MVQSHYQIFFFCPAEAGELGAKIGAAGLVQAQCRVVDIDVTHLLDLMGSSKAKGPRGQETPKVNNSSTATLRSI